MRPLAAAAAAVLALAACDRAAAPDDARIRAYLLEHPEVVEEALARAQQNRQQTALREGVAALAANRGALERDARDYVANPQGRVTVTQFYDYRCGVCITAAPEVLALIRSRPDVRFVFKELPIFGGTSDRAARLALIVKQQGGDGLALYRELMSARPLTDAALDRLAEARGVSPALLDAPAAHAEHLAATRTLADTLRIDGTPTFVVGDSIIPGWDREAVMRAVEAAART